MKFLEIGAVAYKRALIIADLHIGFEIELSRQGINVPNQVPVLIKKLEPYASSFNRLVLLGDIKHEIGSYLPVQRKLVEDFLSWVKQNFGDVLLIRGNHDGGMLGLEPSSGIRLGKLGLFHGHAYPGEEVLQARKLVAAHLHPVYKLGSRKLKCFALGSYEGKEIVILPAFSEIISGVDVNEPREGVLAKAELKEAILLGGEVLPII